MRMTSLRRKRKFFLDEDEYIYADDSLYEKQNKKERDGEDPQSLKDRKKKGKKAKESTANPLLVDLDSEKQKDDKISKAAVWFQKDIFKNVENEEDEDYDLEEMMAKQAGRDKRSKKKVHFETDSKDEDEDEREDESDSGDSDSGDSDVDDRSISQGKTDT